MNPCEITSIILQDVMVAEVVHRGELSAQRSGFAVSIVWGYLTNFGQARKSKRGIQPITPISEE